LTHTTPFDLSGRTILITGASSGIGRQCAMTCAAMGANLLLLGRDKVRMHETTELLTGSAKVTTFLFDLTNEDEMTEFVAGVTREERQITGVIHSAGLGNTLPFKSASLKKQALIFNTNVGAPLELTRLLLKKKVLGSTASIVFISSVMGTVGEAGKTLYGMSKGAIVAAVKSLAIEYAPKKIRFNVVSPGVVETPMSERAIYRQQEVALTKITALHPLGLGQAGDIANACVYLLSDAAKWVTGSQLMVDGGYTAR